MTLLKETHLKGITCGTGWIVKMEMSDNPEVDQPVYGAICKPDQATPEIRVLPNEDGKFCNRFTVKVWGNGRMRTLFDLNLDQALRIVEMTQAMLS